MRMLKNLSDLIANISLKLSCVFILLMTVIIVVQVVLRYVFNSGITFADEFAKYSTIWSVMLAGNVLIKEDSLIKVDFLDHLWPKTFIKVRDTVYQILICVLLVFLVKEGWQQAVAGLNTRLTSMDIAWFWPYLAIPVGALLMLYQCFFILARVFAKENE